MEDTMYFVGVRFAGASKSYYFSTDMDDLKLNDLVVVESAGGIELGTVSTRLMNQSQYKSDLALKPILRRPDKYDLEDYEYNKEQSKRALRIAHTEIENLGLGMNLLEANYTLDGSKVTITYTADERVDFRELLKVLAARLHCKIDLRQIVARDKAKLIGGIGPCGLALCCSTFLNSFESVSITRAKNQMLSLNVSKLSGPCNKLMCCLLYEDDMYTEAKREFPRIGTVVHDEEGDFTVTGFNILSKQVKLSNSDNVRFLPLDEVNDLLRGIKRKKPLPDSIVEDRDASEPKTRNEHGHDNREKSQNRNRDRDRDRNRHRNQGNNPRNQDNNNRDQQQGNNNNHHRNKNRHRHHSNNRNQGNNGSNQQ